MALNGALGLGMILAASYALGNVDDVLQSPTGQAGYGYLDILRTGIGSAGGAAAMGSVVTFMQIFGNVADMAAASRMLWAFSRDRAVPGWKFFLQASRPHSSFTERRLTAALDVQLDPRTVLPIRCIFVSVAVSVLLSLINIGSSTAFNDVIGLVTAGYYGSYLMASGLLLYRRCTGAIRAPASDESPNELVNNVGKTLVWGPWRIPGLCGVLVNGFACVYLTVALFFSFWPSEKPVTGKNMNYNVLVFGAVMIMAVVYYFVKGKREYNGPIVETSRGVFVETVPVD